MFRALTSVCGVCGGRRVLPPGCQLRSRLFLQPVRNIIGTSGKWEPEFNEGVRQDIESYWKNRLKERDLELQFKESNGGQKQYVLSMFPYPSGALHMGHVRVYTISDAMARFYRLHGLNVLHPMGWDAFGLPAENAAIDRGEQPEAWTKSNIQNMKKQLEQLCLSFDWDREYATCDPTYYKWTQYLFLKMYEAGLVYQKEAAVNWDPVDQTVLADEQIDEAGRSWRSGAVAEKRLLRQWYIRTTAYSKSLIEGLGEVDPYLWKEVVELQKHWIGSCDGVRIQLQLKAGDAVCSEDLSVFTRTPELLYGASHVLIAPHHPLNRQPYVPGPGQAAGCKLTVEAVHPFTRTTIPVYLAPDHNFGDHLDSHLGIPSSSKTDAAFAQKHGISFNQVIGEDGHTLVNSEQFTGLKREEAFHKVAEYAKTLKCGGHVTSERARDWLISRQRYWGTPIPVIHCDDCGPVPVPYKDLPVTLPKLDKLTGKGISPLSQAEDWLSVTCPKCGGGARRETDTMDTFVDSSWYYLRYTDPHNTAAPFDRDRAHRLMPVDLYIGGKEHAIMHLYYARFFNHFLHDLGLVPVREPFVNLLTQGMVMGQSYRLRDSGRYITPRDVDSSGPEPVQRGTGAALMVEWEKMSKSKYNGVDPQDVLDQFGTDSTRLCILSNVAPKTDRNWDSNDIVGVLRWQSRMWSLVTTLRTQLADVTSSSATSVPEEELKYWDATLWEARNETIKEVTANIKHSFLLNVAISRLHSFTNTLQKVPPEVAGVSVEYERAVGELVIMVAPLAPMYAAEMWEGLRQVGTSHTFNWDSDVFGQQWPVNDNNYHLNLKVKRGHDDCFEVPLPVSIGSEGQLTRKDFQDLARSHEKFTETLGDLDPGRFSLKVQPGYKVIMTYIESKKEMRARKDRERRKRKEMGQKT